jgi:hypothetical protein
MKRLVLHNFGVSWNPGFRIHSCSDYQAASFDLHVQLQILMEHHFEDVLAYREKLKLESCGDVLHSCEDLDGKDPIILHLHLSTDGGQPFRYKKISLWPLHAMLLDLPLNLRSKKENILMLGLWLSKSKPHWTSFVKDYLEDSIVNTTITLNLRDHPVLFELRIHTSVFDLPALASVLKHNQFNGSFGCIFCCAPGTVIKAGKGHSRKYGVLLMLGLTLHTWSIVLLLNKQAK